MKERLENRLAALREELACGERLLQQLQAQQRQLERNLLRIGGAVKVLQEMLAGPAEAAPVSGPTAEQAAAQDVA